MSLSSPEMFQTLKNEFVCAKKNIQNEAYCGNSGKHPTEIGAVYTTNGAGPRNTQIFLMAADGTVLHCLPGYWQNEDLAHEIAFAKELNTLWTDKSISREEKDLKFGEMHLAHAKEHSAAMQKRSKMQGFDAKHEMKREDSDARITVERKGRSRETLLTTDQLMHKRMAQRPFVSYADFDIAKYSDYGLWKYNKNPGKYDARDPETGKVDKEKMRQFKMEMFQDRKNDPQRKKKLAEKKRRRAEMKKKREEARKEY